MCIQHMLTIALSTEQHVRIRCSHSSWEARPFLNDGCTREPLRGRTLADIAVREERWEEARRGFSKVVQPVRGSTMEEG